MLSKGVDYYAYLGSSPYSVKFQFPSDYGDGTWQSIVSSPDEAMVHGNRQISEDDIGLTDHYGTYRWIAEMNNSQIATKSAEIAPSTGDMGDSDMSDMLQTPSIISSNYAVSYGFYDAGPGWGDLTDQDQSYVYVTRNHSQWMGDLAAAGDLDNRTFSSFALPGVHDAGMFSTTELNSLLNDAEFVNIVATEIGMQYGIPVPDIVGLAKPELLHLLIAFSFTQKDNITTMLDLGIRYFDFRPGYCLPGYLGSLYHQHKLIPGYAYSSFLEDVLRWLNAHPTEIVVISVNYQGFLSTTMEPSHDTLNEYLASAQRATGTTAINAGNKQHLDMAYSALLVSNHRLIFLNQVGAGDDATKYDSYSDAYTTTDPDNVINALNGMSSSHQNSYDYTVLQLQGTAEGTSQGIFANVSSISDATSVILSTKAMFDRKTYKWLRDNVVDKFEKNKLIVFLNDFGDNAMADIAKDITRARG